MAAHHPGSSQSWTDAASSHHNQTQVKTLPKLSSSLCKHWSHHLLPLKLSLLLLTTRDSALEQGWTYLTREPSLLCAQAHRCLLLCPVEVAAIVFHRFQFIRHQVEYPFICISCCRMNVWNKITNLKKKKKVQSFLGIWSSLCLFYKCCAGLQRYLYIRVSVHLTCSHTFTSFM